jgi:radical SAM-linked protein
MPKTQDGRKDMHITGSKHNCGCTGAADEESVPVLIKFSVRDNLRFLSHAETLRVFQRACVRSGIEIRYTEGFNPHPKLSLGLPRTVGVESEDDLAQLKVHTKRRAEHQSETSTLPLDCDRLKKKLSEQLPQGCQLLTVSLPKDKAPLQPTSATYILPIKKEYINEKLKAAIKHLLESESLSMQRWRDEKRTKSKIVDVRGFLKSIRISEEDVIVECKVSSTGSIRVDEILRLLELGAEKLAAPIRRTAVEWQSN